MLMGKFLRSYISGEVTELCYAKGIYSAEVLLHSAKFPAIKIFDVDYIYHVSE
jgi:hypothetical protein